MDEPIDALAHRVVDADTVVAFTGAGVSTASGVPAFRSDGGVWDTHDPADFRVARFQADPAGFWTDRLELRETLYGNGDVSPNAAHEALATLEARGHLDALVTQNVDGLHSAAGSESVVRLHGTGRRVACVSCDRRFPAEPVVERAANGECPPRCEHCDGVLKPDVVLFGESLDRSTLQRARSHAGNADVFLAAGSSLTVDPAASLPGVAHDAGATVAVVNLAQTPMDDRADHVLRADVTAVFPALVDAVASHE